MLRQFQHVREAATATRVRSNTIVESAINLFGDWLRRRRELRDMNSSDLAQIARDLSVTPAELDMVVRQGPHASDEMPRLLQSLGIDATELSRTQPVLQRDMVRVCASCRQKALCEYDLHAGTSAQHYQDYCPNAPAIDEIGLKP